MIGYQVWPRERQVSAAVVEKFSGLPVANISDVMSRMTAGGANLRPLHAKGGLAGPALTVKARPGDNLLVHHALSIAAPGDVVVVDAGGDVTNAIVGELMLSYARVRQIAGVVINGAVRDYGWIKTNDFPVFAKGVTHRGPYRDGPGEINASIAIDGMVIAAGDLIVGDDDGLLCIPYDQVDDVYAAAKAKREAELRSMQTILKGTGDRAWVLESLKKGGCGFI